MRYKLAIFDLDGTILDTISGLAISVNAARVAYGLDSQPLSELEAMVGNGARKLIERSIAYGNDSASVEDILPYFIDHYYDTCCENSAPYEGIMEMLKALREAGMKIAVVSNKDDGATVKLCDYFFAGLIDDSRGHKAGVKHKPDPAPVMATLDKLGINPDEAVFIGDSEVDILTGRNCNMDSISVDWGFKTHEFLKENGASVIISSAIDLKDYLLEKED